MSAEGENSTSATRFEVRDRRSSRTPRPSRVPTRRVGMRWPVAGRLGHQGRPRGGSRRAAAPRRSRPSRSSTRGRATPTGSELRRTRTAATRPRHRVQPRWLEQRMGPRYRLQLFDDGLGPWCHHHRRLRIPVRAGHQRVELESPGLLRALTGPAAPRPPQATASVGRCRTSHGANPSSDTTKGLPC